MNFPRRKYIVAYMILNILSLIPRIIYVAMVRACFVILLFENNLFIKKNNAIALSEN
jgi:hypothetical protein